MPIALRRGLSLLEVMFSIGIIAVGLMGMIIIMPIALRTIGRGRVADSASRVAANALREFESRGMARADQWRRPAWNFPTFPVRGFQQVNWIAGSDGRWGRPFSNDDGLLGTDDVWEAGFPSPESDDILDKYPIAGVSYCLDPLFLASADLVNRPPRQEMQRRGQFPYTLPEIDLLRMMRISLAGRFLASNFALVPPQNFDGAMTWAHATESFLLSDDLLYDIPPQVDAPPEQTLYWPQGQPLPLQRDSEGAFSWMATLVPRPYRLGQRVANYTLSIVVFHRRDLTMPMDEFSTTERVARIQPGHFWSDGVSGGEVSLTPLADRPATDLDGIRSGDWLLLGGVTGAILNGTAGDVGQTFRWYRVLAADGAPDEDGLLAVTLDGPDWPTRLIRGDAQVVIMPQIVTVVERPLQIETGP